MGSYKEIGAKSVHLLDAQVLTSTTASKLVDMKGLAAATFAINWGAYVIGGGSGVSAVLEESDTTVDGDFTTVATADKSRAFTGLTSGSDDQFSEEAEYFGSKRYVRVKITLSASSTSQAAGVTALVKALVEPTTAPAAVSAT